MNPTGMFDLSDVGHVERIMIGSADPERPVAEADVVAATARLNRCLSDVPRGRLLGIEKTFHILNIGEHQVVLQALIYHVGFRRKPAWLE